MARPSYTAECDCGRKHIVPRRDGVQGGAVYVTCQCGRDGPLAVIEVHKEAKTLRRGGSLKRKGKKKRTKLAKTLMTLWWERTGKVCSNCGAKGDDGVLIHGHHVTRQRLIEDKAKEEGWPQEKLDRVLWDERNRLDVCDDCHDGHHKRGQRLPWSLVDRDAQEFAQEIGLLRRIRREYVR